MKSLSGQTILVLGAGASGLAAARLAQSVGARVIVLDSANGDALQQQRASLAPLGIELRLGWQHGSWDAACDMAVTSPGIAAESALGQLAASLPCPVLSELAFGAGYCPWSLWAVTGTNGKTTTVEMLVHALRTAGRQVTAGGNIGLPLSSLAMTRPALDCLITEVSSFQLERPKGFAPAAAALLNVSPDHLNRHGTMDAYLALKLSLLQLLPSGKQAVIHQGLLADERVKDALAGRPYLSFSATAESDADYQLRDGCLWRRGMNEPLLALHELAWHGQHNAENALAALALAESAGMDGRELVPGLRSFHSGAHRLCLIAEKAGVRFVDDSKATNVDALARALAALGRTPPDIALIAGGLDKGCTLEEVRPALRRYVKKAFLIGDCKERLAASWGEALPCELCEDLPEAVHKAAHCVAPQGTVLLSPACASQDMFHDYVHRGRVFADAVAGWSAS